MTLLDSALEKMVLKSAKNKDQVISSQIKQFWIFLILFVTKPMQIRDNTRLVVDSIVSCVLFCFVLGVINISGAASFHGVTTSRQLQPH